MIIETELKFPVTDFGPVQDKLGCLSGKHTSWYFEQNIVLDDEKGSLRKRDCLLRLRTGREHKLTLKLPMEEGGGRAKSRQEYETSLGNIRDMNFILEFLGFQPWLRYEKFRQVWDLGALKVCLDILPFGRFVEIEGPEEKIIETALNLGLDPLTATAGTYHQLNREMSGQGAAADDFVFDDDLKNRIEAELDTGVRRYDEQR
jgi:adenylate cyclase, class 2